MKKLAFLFAFTLLIAVSAYSFTASERVSNPDITVQADDDDKDNKNATTEDEKECDKEKKEGCEKKCSAPCEK